MRPNPLSSQLRFSLLATLLFASSAIFGAELADRFVADERARDVYDLISENPLPYLSNCEDGCHVGIKGLAQTLLIPVTERGEVTTTPLLIEKPVEMDKLYVIDLPFREGFQAMQIGEDRYGVWVFSNGEMVFAKAKSASADNSTASTKGARFFGGPSTGGTFDPTEDDSCPTRRVVDYDSCTRLSDGSIKLVRVEKELDCHNNVVDVHTYTATIGPPLSYLVQCSSGT